MFELSAAVKQDSPRFSRPSRGGGNPVRGAKCEANFRFAISDFRLKKPRAVEPLRGKPRKGRNITAQGDANEVSGALGQRTKDKISALNGRDKFVLPFQGNEIFEGTYTQVAARTCLASPWAFMSRAFSANISCGRRRSKEARSGET
jgi:hypothetical protein